MLESGAEVMLGNGSVVEIALLIASTEQSYPIDWSTVRTWLEQISPYPWLTALVVMGILALLFLLNIGDQLSGILSWLGVPSPFQQSQPSTEQLERTRQQLLKIVKKEFNLRLANSLHNLVKLDLYMEDQRQRLGSPKFELVSEDSEPSFQAVNRILHTKGNKPPLDLKLTQKIIEVFERQDIQGKLLILGDPGSGKTTELLQLAQDLVTRVEEDDQHPVPVILELSSWDGESIDKWVAKQLNKLYSLSRHITQQWLTGNQILLLLDGLDELGLTKQRQCIDQINQFLEVSRTPELVVCCRREEYEAGEIELDGLNGAVYLEALKEDQIRQYFEELNRLSLWSNISGNSALRELAQNPLFLFMLVVAYQGKPIRNEQELFDAYIKKQLHDLSNQGTYKPGKEPTPEKTRRYLVWVAKQLETDGKTEFLIEGLQPTWLASKFQRSLHAGLSRGIIVGSTIGLLFGLALIDSGNRISESLIIGGFIGGFIGLPVGLGLSGEEVPVVIQPAERIYWSFKDGLVGGLITGAISITMGGIPEGISAAIFGGFVIGCTSGQIEEKKVPNQGIRKGVQNIFKVGGCIGLFCLLSGVDAGLPAILMFWFFSALYFRLGAIIKHLILRIFLTLNGNTPWNYARFLDHAVKHRFIQRTGGRYRFVHDLLRKHFAAMPLPPRE